MDILTALNPKQDYAAGTLQMIVGAWILATAFESKSKVSSANGHVEEDDYDKRSIYALLYSIYHSIGEVRDERGKRYEVTFNTWGYTWPSEWGPAPASSDDPERFGKNAYTGLFAFDAIKQYVREHDDRVHLVEMGCGTGAGADHICSHVLPKCTYEAVDMQQAAINTCRRKFVPRHHGRLVGTRADCTQLPIRDESADIVVVNETHVTEMPGVITDEDRRFFRTAKRILKPGGHLVWGNAIPDVTWKPCFDFLDSIGMKMVEERDVTKEAIAARDQDIGRVDAFVDQALDKFHGFRIPVLGPKKREEAKMALLNFYRNPGTNLYQTMIDRTDTYRVACIKKTA